MEQVKATIAFPFPVGTSGYGITIIAQEVCKANGLTGDPAKLGPHATIIQPFLCEEKDLQIMAAMGRLVWGLNGQEHQARIANFGIFGPAAPDSSIGAIYLALEIPEHYRRTVERYKLNWPFPFVHPPARTNATDRIWNPHISVIEGPLLHEQARPLLSGLNGYVEDRIVHIGEPLVFRERKQGESKWWEQVHV